MKLHADIFKALADETRLTIIALLLRQGELCVCDVESLLRISQSKASRHLRYLKNAGLLEDRREGLWVYYRVKGDADADVDRILRTNDALIRSLLDQRIEERIAAWNEKNESCVRSCGSTEGKE